MGHKIKTVYVIHHSHTDIGYTDLQERVIDNQTDYIDTVLEIMKQPGNENFRWNCESLFCVEQFLKHASEEKKEEFLTLARGGKIGLSANYLNFTDLLDTKILGERLGYWQTYFAERDITMKTAMFADINGISMGCRNELIRHGVEFLYTNIHCHHGMYPLRQNQTLYWWENADGQRLLVWNGEHYNLGNVLGLKPNHANSYMQSMYMGNSNKYDQPLETLHTNLDRYLNECEEQGYHYNFIITSVSGVFSDNAPPAVEIMEMINAYNRVYDDVKIRMVSLPELYEAVRDSIADAPVYRGDLTDWWANGVGSTPYAVKHYREARHAYHLNERLDPQAAEKYPQLFACAQDNLMLYAEHTWGHSSTITNPYDTMTLNLDIRKNSYASKAHEASAVILHRIMKEKGDIFRYYNTDGTIRVYNVNKTAGPQVVEFYIESMDMPDAVIQKEDGQEIRCQVSKHPRGRKITFVDTFAAGEEKTYTYKSSEAKEETLNTRQCYSGSERVRDIVNTYDTETYHLPYYFENDFFQLSYRVGEGITSFIDKRTGKELTGKGEAPFFTPIYEVTKIRSHKNVECPEELERRLLGRNIRGTHAELFCGKLVDLICEERGEVFTLLRLKYKLPGSIHTEVVLKFYAALPRIDFTLELGKTLSTDIESIFMPLSLTFGDSSLYLRKGEEAFRPGIDQIPDTCMEFYMSDQGLAYVAENGGAVIAMRDTPLVYMGEMRHHPIVLCDGKKENNERPVYSWVMNNMWETNFKMDLAGFGEYRYSLWLTEEKDPEAVMDLLEEKTYDPYVMIV